MRRLFVKLVGAICALALTVPVTAQESPDAFAGYTVRPLANPDGVSVQDEGGVQTLTVARASVMLDGAQIADGVIEFDFAFENKRGFGGIVWHSSADGENSEYMYFRQHKSGLPDAVQYTPVRSGLSGWQIYNDRNAMAPFAYTYDGWNHVKIVIAGDRADVFLNGSKTPQLHVPDLASDRGSGGIGFRASGPNGRMTVANLTVRPLASGEGIVGSPAEVAEPPAGVIGQWTVSAPFEESLVTDALTLPQSLPPASTGEAVVAVEPSGIADLARVTRLEEGADTVLVSTRINSDEARSVRLRFGYSDRVRLFLNGDLIFDGVADFRARDFFFLGNVGFNDAVVLNLREGENTLTAAVSETFGGWAMAGAIKERAGLRISP